MSGSDMIHLREHDLLLIAARETLDDLVDAGAADPHLLPVLAGRLVLLALVDHLPPLTLGRLAREMLDLTMSMSTRP